MWVVRLTVFCNVVSCSGPGPLLAGTDCCRHAEREDYAWKRRGENWQAQAERPWDTPLTPVGHKQSTALGQGIAEHLGRPCSRSILRWI
jgi:hypothetical protein